MAPAEGGGGAMIYLNFTASNVKLKKTSFSNDVFIDFKPDTLT